MQTHKSLKHFEKAIKKRNCCPDVVKINSIIYTLDCYDMEGKEISFGNKRTLKGFIIKTSDRYNKGFFDSKVFQNDGIIRNDISYYD